MMRKQRAGGIRRRVLIGATGAAALALARPLALRQIMSPARASEPTDATTVPFWGEHQGGITTPQQQHMMFAAFDLTTPQRADIVALLRAWTTAAARMARAEPALPLAGGFVPVPRAAPANAGPSSASPSNADPSNAAPSNADPSYADEEAPDWAAVAADTGEAIGLPATRLSVTFGFGAGLFVRDGADRYGLAKHRPEALVDLPKFTGDQLVTVLTDGDLAVQVCADDPQVAFHAMRQLVRLADGIASIRWMQSGFLPGTPRGDTPRNLMGFRDGTANPDINDPDAMRRYVWVGAEGPDWMQGGSYVVNRRIRIALERWDRMKVAVQEATVGRVKDSGAPLGAVHETDPLPLDAQTPEGDPVIAENAHVRLATAATNDGARILRRGYAYSDGLSLVAERWPPWHQGLEYDAGLLFIAYQRDPRTGFIKIFERMAKFDMMNQFVTHIGGGLFACPRGAAEGEYVGQRLFEAA